MEQRGDKPSIPDRHCEPLPDSYYHAEPISGTWTVHRILSVTGIPLVVITGIITLALVVMHLKNYTNPSIQRQLVRTILVPASFSIFGFFALTFYHASEYLVPVADLYEAFALLAFFFFMIITVTPDEDQRLAFFAKLERKTRRGKVIPGGSLGWYSVRAFPLLAFHPFCIY
jgi:hypothetical protein